MKPENSFKRACLLAVILLAGASVMPAMGAPAREICTAAEVRAVRLSELAAARCNDPRLTNGPAAQAVSALRPLHLKPYRVLVVAGTQMRDSHVIDGGSDFADIAALLKLWGVPFDVMRLDTRTMGASDFADSAGQPKYGVIIWTAGQTQYPWQPQDYSILAEAVKSRHISLIAISNRIEDRTIQDLLGLHYAGWKPMPSRDFLIDGPAHFITRGLGPRVAANAAFCGPGNAAAYGWPNPVARGPTVADLKPDVISLATAGGSPQLAVRTVDAPTRTRAVWIGGNGRCAFANPTFIKLLRRALVWALGYAVYKDYGHSVVLRMDDPGCAGSAYLRGLWHYPQLTLEDFRNNVVAPLRAHHARLGVAFCAGYPDPGLTSRSIVRSWTVHFNDHIDGTPQYLDSTYAGLKLGMRAGVIEVHSHGLTHMTPDLGTAPAGGVSWWDGSATSEWPDIRWYREFLDERHASRPREIEAAVQTQHLSQSAAWITEAFGRPPLMFVPPGHDISGAARFNRARYEGGGRGSITVSLRGAAPNAGYTVRYGSETWTALGSVLTNASGRGWEILAFPPAIAGTTGKYFTLNRDTTQFIAGPVVHPLSYAVNLSLRDGSQMTPAERAKFAAARDTLTEGSVSGSRYRPMHVSPKYTYKLAADVGYGIANDTFPRYLGRDYVITLLASRVFKTGFHRVVMQGNFDRGAPAVLYHHDLDVVRHPQYYNATLRQIETIWPDVYYLSMDEWTAYLHASLDAAAPGSNSARFSFSYDDHYCRYFRTNASQWVLHLSDEVAADLRALGPTIDILVDGKRTGVVNSAKYFTERVRLSVPAGAGIHSIVFQPDTGCAGSGAADGDSRAHHWPVP